MRPVPIGTQEQVDKKNKEQRTKNRRSSRTLTDDFHQTHEFSSLDDILTRVTDKTSSD